MFSNNHNLYIYQLAKKKEEIYKFVSISFMQHTILYTRYFYSNYTDVIFTNKMNESLTTQNIYKSTYIT